MLNIILENIKNNKDNYAALEEEFKDINGLGYKLVDEKYENKKLIVFDKFEDITVIQPSEIPKGFRFFLKISTVYSIANNKDETFIFALDCSINKSFKNFKINDMKIK